MHEHPFDFAIFDKERKESFNNDNLYNATPNKNLPISIHSIESTSIIENTKLRPPA